MFFALKKNLLY